MDEMPLSLGHIRQMKDVQIVIFQCTNCDFSVYKLWWGRSIPDQAALIKVWQI